MPIILIILSLLLDGYLSTIISSSSYFLPLLTLTTIYLIYPKYNKKIRSYKLIVIIVGLIYDLLYTNLLLFHAVIFYILSFLIIHIYKNYSQTKLTTILSLIILIVVYELLVASIFFIFQVSTITFIKLITKIFKSLLLNIIYPQNHSFHLHTQLLNNKSLNNFHICTS